MRKRHTVFWVILRPLVIVFLWLKFGYRYRTPKDLPENYIVLCNHNTDYDPVFVGASFPRQMYVVASEHLSRWKLFWLLDFVFAPILRYKGTVASSTVMQTLKRVKAGANVCIFAEGARSWDGITGPILPSTGKLVKSAKCGLVTYKLVGGYFVSPNWSHSNTRRGPIHGEPVGVYTKEQLAEMSVDEINTIIKRDLYEDAYERQLQAPQRYKGKNLAYCLENFLYMCPACGKIDTLHSHDNTVSCSSCGFSFQIDEYGMLKNAPYKTVRDLGAWQKEVTGQDAAAGKSYTAETGVLKSITKQTETLVDQGRIILSPESLRCGDTEIPLSDISDMAIHGKNALVFAVGRTYYEMIPGTGYNALKFMVLFQSHKQEAVKTKVGG